MRDWLAPVDEWSMVRASVVGTLGGAGVVLGGAALLGPWGAALGAGAALGLAWRAAGTTEWLVDGVEVAPEPELAPEAEPELAEPAPGALATFAGQSFAYIPAGSFLMGDEYPDEKPVHKVELSRGFYMAAHPVTQGWYTQVMGTNPSSDMASEQHPVTDVSWLDAVDFCIKLSELEGLRPAYTREGETVTWHHEANGYRLPTEAEWEYAARAGTTTKYWSGDTESDLARVGWYRDNSDYKTHPVGEKPANPWGLYDVHGNVYEWVYDRYAGDFYQESPARDPRGPASGRVRVSRGGSFVSGADFARSAYRGRLSPGGRGLYLGFRVLRPVPQRGPWPIENQPQRDRVSP